MLKTKIKIIITIIIIIIILFIQNKKEYFHTNFRQRYCGNCGKLGRLSCNDCVDCGYCTTYDGRSECVPGDERGPYFRDDCYSYNYNQPIQIIPLVQPYVYKFNNDYLFAHHYW